MGDLRVWCQLSVYPGACDGNGDLRDDEMEIMDIWRLHKAFITPALEADWLKTKNSRLNMMWG
ncbi:hypothetical protein HZD82_21785 [Pantoea agglomerans]|uniref:hypothetical protein n=1 Tax=Enterobacter agglomerans TaxID=549 RepID=UPI001A8D28F8|nr:hypothetical protein [Pantoea agglomerans]MBN9931223.1 hypothetical protein [Pantoea agglomerans]